MIYEFAVEPELIFEWARERRDGAYFADAFGLGRPRILAAYPNKKDWRKLVQQHAAAEYERLKNSAKSDEDRIGIQAWKLRYDAWYSTVVTYSKIIDRKNIDYAREKTWLDNAIEHAPEPFHAILARFSSMGSEYVLAGDDIAENPRWRLDTTCSVDRNPAAMAAIVAPLLRRCERVIFVDPYFRPQSSEHVQVFSAFLGELSTRKGLAPPIIDVVSSNKKEQRWDYFKNEFLKKAIKKAIDAELPVEWKVRIHWISEKASGEQVHNRYVLTDLGGIKFGIGLDSGRAGTTDDVSLMERNLYELRWKQYSPGSDAFHWDPNEQLTIAGTKRIDTVDVIDAPRSKR